MLMTNPEMLMNPPATFAATRVALQRVATHVLARRRATLCGKFGLRATPAGIGTPACGPDHEIVRISGTRLIRERTGEAARTTSLDLTTATLADAAALVEVDLDAPFDAGHDTMPVGDPTTPVGLDPSGMDVLARWYAFGWTVLDRTLAALGPDAGPTVLQLWPEHLDVGCDVAASPEIRTNVGASPGDEHSEEPYLYVGPWTDQRPGDASYWNASFGAVLRYGELQRTADPISDAVTFLVRGAELLGS